MSRMTKFLKQKATWEKAELDENGKPILNEYGDPSFQQPVEIACRRERTMIDILTTTGAIVKSSTVYYVDETVPVHMGDKFDGLFILDFEEYINGEGECEGYRVVV